MTAETHGILTSWIQASAAFVAVILTGLTVIKLFSKDRQRTEEVDSLKRLAQSNSGQLDEVRTQTKIMSDANIILAEYHAALLKHHEADTKTKQYLIEIENKRRRDAIKPFFSKSGGQRIANVNWTIPFRNMGKRARSFKVTIVKAGKAIFPDSVKNWMVREVPEGGVVELAYQTPEGNAPRNHPGFEVKFHFLDGDLNEYSQLLRSVGLDTRLEDPILEKLAADNADSES